ncbi:DUF2934 domain-containing protein [Pseudoroseomonas wenyumeiae]
MSDDREAREQRIRERAYALWEAGGRQEGAHEEHWHRARQEIEGTGISGSLDDQLRDTFPASDPPSITAPDTDIRALPAAPEDEPFPAQSATLEERPEAPVRKPRAAAKKADAPAAAAAAPAAAKGRAPRRKPGA